MELKQDNLLKINSNKKQRGGDGLVMIKSYVGTGIRIDYFFLDQNLFKFSLRIEEQNSNVFKLIE